MQIRPVDVFDDEEFHAFHEILEASRRFERRHAVLWTEQEAAVTFRSPDDSEDEQAFGAFDGDRMVGAAIVALPLLDNRDKVYFTVDVPPQMRRRGIGTMLVHHIVDRARSAGRTVLIGDSHYPVDADESHPYRQFAASCGFELGNTELHRILELPVPDEKIQDWLDESAPHHPGYRIQTYQNDLPEVILPSYVELLNQLAVDAPTGDLDFEEEALTVDVFKQRRDMLREQGRSVYVTVATVGSGDAERAVAHSVLAVPQDGLDEPNVYQWATLVHRAHRGHRLGMATKATNLREVQKRHPDRRLVHTSNAQANGPMVAINERIGFHPVEVNAEFQRKLG